MPPATRIGGKSLSGRSAAELAFIAGKHLAHHRAQEFMRALIPGIADLEDIFLAALSIGNPGMPMNDRGKQIVVPIAKAIEPILEPLAIDQLRGHFLRFVEEGGRTNLQRWASGVDRTVCRAGLLLANDLRAAQSRLRSRRQDEDARAHGRSPRLRVERPLREIAQAARHRDRDMTDLDALEKAFEAGNYRAVRDGVTEIEKSDASDDVKKKARELRSRTEPSRAQIALLVIAGALVLALSGYEIIEHGKNSAPPIQSAPPRTSVEHVR